jgi:hypothetical protein
MSPLLMLIDSSKKERISKREFDNYLSGNEKTRNFQLGFIDDINVMGVFIVC